MDMWSNGRVAQWIRRPTSNRKIVGSIPIVVKIFAYFHIYSETEKSQKVPLRVGFEPTREDPI